MSQKLIGIDLGGTSVKLAIISQEGEILEKWTIATNILEEGRHIVPDIIASLKEHLALYQLTTQDFIGIGMGSPGRVDGQAGTVTGAYNLNWRHEQAVASQFKQAFDLPFIIGNDANIAALGEQWIGAGKGSADVALLTLGTGVGGGIVTNGQLVTGNQGAAGEVGHMTVALETGLACTCGKEGCLETVASATGMVNLAKQHAQAYVGDSPIKMAVDNGDELTAKMIVDAAKVGDYFASQVFDDFCRYLGLACSHIANLLSPHYIIIGGGVSAAGSFLLEGVQAYYYRYTFPQIRETTQLVLAQLGNDAGVIGAAQLVKLTLKEKGVN